MVLHTYKAVDSLWAVLYRLKAASVHIWEIWPTVFTIMCFIINYKIIAKRGTVIFVHSYSIFSLYWCKFFVFKLFRRRNKETLLFAILFIYPLFRGFPLERAKSNYHLVMLSFCYHYSIRYTIALLVKDLSRKFMLCGSIK